ncbi:hypothetical protein BASA81_002373 [Batrachochytrium salamandrivorans]|nr:hypothetical protein BASA81_002373 [Batrachochytrium salamandrivorans]
MFAWLFGTAAVSNNALKFKRVVAHRGLHDPQLEESRFAKGTSQRVPAEGLVLPVENSLMAYRSAWAMGFFLAECDVTSTVDGEVFLLHDETFERVGALDGNPLNKKQATDLTSKELATIRLRDDSPVPTLLEVLELARKMSSPHEPPKQMVVEFKQDGMFPSANSAEPTQSETDKHLALVKRVVSLVTDDLFVKHPEALQHVGLMFTFGPEIVRLLCEWKLRTGNTVPVMLLTEGSRMLPQNKSFSLQLGNDESVARAVVYHREYKGQLDGLFVEFENDMLVSGSPVQRNLIELIKHMKVGVWFYEDQVDGLGQQLDNGTMLDRPCYEYLLELGVWLVNANIQQKDGNQ